MLSTEHAGAEPALSTRAWITPTLSAGFAVDRGVVQSPAAAHRPGVPKSDAVWAGNARSNL